MAVKHEIQCHAVKILTNRVYFMTNKQGGGEEVNMPFYFFSTM
jgi:hypothetical protein